MKKYLVLQLARLGDLLQSKRLILSLAAEGAVHLAVDTSLIPLAAQIYPQTVLHPLPAHAGSLHPHEVLRLAKNAFTALQAQHFDQVYNLNRSPLSLAPAGIFDPEQVTGYRLQDGQPLTSAWARMGIRWTRSRRSAPMNLMDFWAFFHPAPVPPARVNPQAKGLDNAKTRIGVVLAGREARRSLPPAVLAPLLEAVFAWRKGPEFLLLGDAKDRETADRVLRRLPPVIQQKTRNLSGQTRITDLSEILRELDLLLTPDTGIMHLAAHLGTPVMAAFLSSAWAWETGPYGIGHQIWQALPPCAPCLESTPCPHNQVCLRPFKIPAQCIPPDRGAAGAENSLLLLKSGLDELGSTLHGQDPAQEDRQAARSLLAEFLGLPHPARTAPFPRALCEDLLAERDWMLPEYGPATIGLRQQGGCHG